MAKKTTDASKILHKRYIKGNKKRVESLERERERLRLTKKPKKQPKIRLNLGAADTAIKGFTPIDRKFGQEVYPLKYEDNSVDEIRASHVLEHFPSGKVLEVLEHWVAKLKPGGILKIAVPNFRWVAENYLAGTKINTTGYIMGGQVDDNDFHHALFDKDSLAQFMGAAGLANLGSWTSEIQDCAALPVSLNVQGTKLDKSKPVEPEKPVKISAVMSMPRLAFTDNIFSAVQSILPLGISLEKGCGVFWNQVLTNMIEAHLDDGTDFILTLDYDTWFNVNHVKRLAQIMVENPDVDAAVPVQTQRQGLLPLVGMDGPKGAKEIRVDIREFQKPLTDIKTGHFGLTMLRAESLKKIKRPWMRAKPNKEGRWQEGRRDADIVFWDNFIKAGLKAVLCNDVYIGHLELMCTFPGLPANNWEPIRMHMPEVEKNGPPRHCDPMVTMLR